MNSTERAELILLYGSMPPALVDKYLDNGNSEPRAEVRETAAIILSST